MALKKVSMVVCSKTFPAQFNQDPNPSFSIVKSAVKHDLIKELIKKLFSVHYLLSLPSFPFQLIQSLLFRVITFPNWYKKNALALHISKKINEFITHHFVLIPNRPERTYLIFRTNYAFLSKSNVMCTFLILMLHQCHL